MTTEHIKQIFTDYIKTDKTQYAIMLNGSWGCGKTYFWKYTLEEIAKKNDFKTIYVSLNGISRIDDLDHQLFIKLLPFISNQENKAIKNATTFLGNIINKVSSHYLKSSLSDIFKGVGIDTFNFSEHIVCFDDLERCQIPVKEVLGFINNLVEHKNLKTIILAHEAEIVSTNGYERIKEKVVGRDLKFELDISTTLLNLFNKYKTNIDFHNFLTIQKSVVTEILIEYKQDNLRIISFYLDTLERIFPVLKNVEEKYVQEIILFSAIITIEYKSGDLTSADYKDFKGIKEIDEYHNFFNNITRAIRKSESEETERERTYAEVFYEKYLEKRVETYFFYSSIYSFILSGFFNQAELESEVKKRCLESIPKKNQDFSALLNYEFRELSDDDFKRLTKDVLQYAKEGEYFIYDYVKIASYFYFFSKNNLITESKEDINKILNDGLVNAKARKEINDEKLERLLRSRGEDPDVTVFKNLVKEIHNEIKKEEYAGISNELIDCLANKDEFALAEIFKKHKFSKELFQYIDDKLLLDTILKISNKQLFNFTELLRHRYEVSNIGAFLFEDTDCLNKVRTGLSDYLDKNNNIEPLRKFLLTTLETALKEVLEHLENTKMK